MGLPIHSGTVPRYSTDIAAAWKVRDRVKGWAFHKGLGFIIELTKHRWWKDGQAVKSGDMIMLIEAEDICLAALAAVDLTSAPEIEPQWKEER